MWSQPDPRIRLTVAQAEQDNLGRVVQSKALPGPAPKPSWPRAQARQRLAKVTLGRTTRWCGQGAASRQSLDQDPHALETPKPW